MGNPDHDPRLTTTLVFFGLEHYRSIHDPPQSVLFEPPSFLSFNIPLLFGSFRALDFFFQSKKAFFSELLPVSSASDPEAWVGIIIYK